MGQLVNLRWTSHHQDLIKGIWNLFQEKYKTDFQVSLNGNYISAHQMIMSVFCPAIKNASNNTIILGEKPSVSEEDMDSVLKFLYCGKVRVQAKRLGAMMNISDQMGFKVLSQLIAQSLKVIERKNHNASKRNKSPPMMSTKGTEKKSNLRIVTDSTMKTRSATKSSTSGKEFIELPSNNVVNLKDRIKESKLSDKVVEESKVASENSDILTSAAFSTLIDDNVANAVQKPPQNLDYLYLESFNPQTFEYICKHCSKGFAKAYELKNHLQVHDQPKTLLDCKHCDYKTSKRGMLWEHMINRHQMNMNGDLLPKNLQCPDCSFMCCAKFQLKHHIFRVHAEKRHVCESCGYRSCTNSGLKKHKRLVHSNVKPLICETCGYQAKVFANLRRHMRMHFCSKVSCDICGASVAVNHLSDHKRMLHSSAQKPFGCNLCQFRSWKNWNLKVHLRSVHQVEPNDQQMDLEADLI